MRQPPKYAKAKTACDIAGLDPQILRESVAEVLPCIPETTPGVARVFDVDQIVMLMIFARLIRHGMQRKAAGRIACAIYSKLRHDFDEKAQVARYYFAPPGLADPSSCAVLYLDEGETAFEGDASVKQTGRLFSFDAEYLDYPVAAFREVVRHRLQVVENNRAVGEGLED